MTPLQKALLECCALLSRLEPDAFRIGVVEGGCGVVFASAVGELDSNLTLLRSVLRRELPVSPTAFQHSVHNCPAGYFSIAFALRNPMVTLCGGYLSADKALLLAASNLADGCEPTAAPYTLVIVADEVPTASDEQPAPGPQARAEALLLERIPHGMPLLPGTYLARCAFASFPASLEERERLTAARLHEEAAAGVPEWPSLIEDVPRARIVTAVSGERVETLWTVRT